MKRRILIADDYPRSAECLANWFRLLGHEAEIATDGLAAIERAEEFRPHMVLLDVGLPKLNG